MELFSRRRRKKPSLPAPESTTYSGSLTPREYQVLLLIAEGYTRKEVGEVLYIGEETVKSHMRNVHMKLGGKNTPHCIAIAFRKGMLGISSHDESINRIWAERQNRFQFKKEKR